MPDATTPSALPEKEKKKKRKKQERNFDYADADLLQKCRTKHQHYLNHLPQFTAFDTAFDAVFAADWLARIEEGEGLQTDNSIQQATADIAAQRDEKVKELILKVGAVEHYANKAFKDEPDALYEFQFNKVQRPDQYNLNFIVNCNVIRMLAIGEHNAHLAAAGMNVTVTDELETVLDEVAELEMAHEHAKRIRMKRTRERIKHMNKLYDTLETVRKAALIIFADKPEVSGLFG